MQNTSILLEKPYRTAAITDQGDLSQKPPTKNPKLPLKGKSKTATNYTTFMKRVHNFKKNNKHNELTNLQNY